MTPPSVDRLNCPPPAQLCGRAPSLVLEAVTCAAGLINCEPLLVPSSRVSVGLKTRPGLAAV